uniref:C2 domain-containing protein n=1 Tax=Syphacia muris TaxID=451379 RepID=A0A0N5AJ81_9BILA
MLSEKRRSTDSFVRFRHPDDLSCPSSECDNSSRTSCDEPDLTWKGAATSTYYGSHNSVPCSRRLSDPELRMEISVSQLDKRVKLKSGFFEPEIEIFRKGLTTDSCTRIYRTSSISEAPLNVTKFREVVISQDLILAGAKDRIVKFCLRNINSDEVIGEAEILFSKMLNDGKFALKLYSREFNSNSLFGVARRSLHCIGTLTVKAYFDNSTFYTSSRGSYNSTDSNKEDDELREQNVMLASGRTQAYLISLLAPTTEVRLRQHIANKSNCLFDSYYCYPNYG